LSIKVIASVVRKECFLRNFLLYDNTPSIPLARVSIAFVKKFAWLAPTAFKIEAICALPMPLKLLVKIILFLMSISYASIVTSNPVNGFVVKPAE